jgi:hypothetical protein
MTSRAPRQRSGLRAFRKRSLVVSLTACSALAGCGGNGHVSIARTDAAPIAALARKIAAEGPCAQRRDIAQLRQQAYALVSSRRLPASIADPFVSGVNALTADAPPCVPAVPVAPVKKPKPKGPPKKHPHHGHGRGDQG